MDQKIPSALNRKISKPRCIRVNMPISLALILLSSLALTYCCFRIQPIHIEDIWKIIEESEYEIFWLNWLPLLLSMLLFYALLNSAAAACGITGGVSVLLSFINRNLINLRQDPLKPLDLLLGGEFFGIAKSLDHKLLILAAAGVAFFLAFFALCVFFVRNKRMHIAARLVFVAVMAFTCTRYYLTALSDPELYDSLAMEGNRYNTTANFESKGFIYSFLHAIPDSRVSAPPSYDSDKSAIASQINGFSQVDLGGAVKPNIILILSEAFSDVLLNIDINFDRHTDPMANYKRLLSDCVSGHIIVPNIGGGTSDTEFDIFTGLNSRHLRGTPYAYSLITKPVKALPSILSEMGYDNLALHPGYGWFYNRKNVYRYIGFSEFFDIDSYDASETKGMYVTERQTIERIIREYEQHWETSPGTPFFEFCVTIQNHGPYPGKYNAEKNFDSELVLSGQSESALANYIEGLIDCDRELGVLTDYLSSRREPVVLVYYGDHMPSFTTELFNTLLPPIDGANTFEGASRLYRTPFIIWQNEAAKAQTPLLGNCSAAGLDQGGWEISSSYLGANLLSLLGLGGTDPFMDCVERLSGEYPVVLEESALERGGAFVDLGADPRKEIGFYKSWEYYWVSN